MRRVHLALVACVVAFPPGCASGRPAPDSAASGSPAAPSATRSAPPSAAPSARRPAETVVGRLRQGGYVLYIRHAATESTQDDPMPDLADPGTQRNLSAAGRKQATEIGRAVRRLRIPIGQVLVSPYNRTRETAELAFGKRSARDSREIINEAFPGTDDDRLAQGLRRLLGRPPAGGRNDVLVSHGFNLQGATGLSAAEGETVVFDPRARKPPAPVGRINIDEWRSLRG